MEDEATQSLLFNGRDVIVIQYVGSSMADELLSKFPDNSAFDFDYSQSSIWSPLVPRFHSLSCLPKPESPNLKRKLSFDNDCKVFDKIPLSRIKKKICAFGLNLNSKLQKKRKMMMGVKKFNTDPSDLPCSPPSRKGWKKVLKMTTKQFKKKRDHHYHHHPISDVTLSDYFQPPNF